VLCAFDLLELDGQDLRRLPIEQRKAPLAHLLLKPSAGVALNAHVAGDGASVFAQACKLAARASCRSGWARHTAPIDPSNGSK